MVRNNFTIIGILLALLIIIAGCQGNISLPSDIGDLAHSESFDPGTSLVTEQFNSVQDLKTFLSTQGSTGGGRIFALGGAEGDFAVLESSATKASSAPQMDQAISSFSETNVQVKGVDEGDIIKTDGEYIYTITGKTLFVIKAYPGEEAKIQSTLYLEGTPRGIFIQDNKIVVYGDVTTLKDYDDFSFRPSGGLSFFNIYDASNKKELTLVKEFKMEGSAFQSRMIGDYVYFVVNSWPDYRRPVPMPLIMEGGEERTVALEDLRYFPVPYENTQFTSIHAISLKDYSLNSKTLVVEGSQNMYMSQNNIYITYTKYINEWQLRQTILIDVVQPQLPSLEKAYLEKVKGVDTDILTPQEKKSKMVQTVETYLQYLPLDEQERIRDEVEKRLKDKLKSYISREYTVLHRVAVDEGSITVKANGKLPGTLVNQFALDEYHDVLRVATTIRSQFNIEPMVEEAVDMAFESEEIAVASIAPMPPRRRSGSVNQVYTLDLNLNILDTLGEIAEGESIFSTRFMGDRLYMVTFRQVDPFFVIDLSNPLDIKALGELKIPGFSRYLHPYDEDTIIGIGRDATEEGRVTGLKVSLFDVKDVNNPKEVAKYVSKERYAQSTAEYEHHAFLFSKEKNLLVIPAYNYDYREQEKSYNGAMVFDITKDSIQVKGLIDHSKGTSKRWYQPSVERSLYIEELLYTKSSQLLRINQLDDLSSVKEIALNDVYQGEIPIF